MAQTSRKRNPHKNTRTSTYGRLFVVGVHPEGVNLNHISNENHRVQEIVDLIKLRSGETYVFFNRLRTRCRLVTMYETVPPMPTVQLVPYDHTNLYRSHARVLEALLQCTDVRSKRDEMSVIRNMASRARQARAFAESLDASREETIQIIRDL